MNSSTEGATDTAGWEGLRRSYEAGRLAHAYVLSGATGADRREAARRILTLLFCGAKGVRPCGECPGCRRVVSGGHPDVFRVEPRSKNRQIRVKEEMEPLLHFLQQTAYEGGWKVGIIEDADCLNPASANKFLKTLEEPPPRTLILLLTSRPEALLPTIRSRCQQVRLAESGDSGALDPLVDAVRQWLRLGWPRTQAQAHAWAGQLAALLAEERASIDENEREADPDADKNIVDARSTARYRARRQEVFQVLQSRQRDLLLHVLGTPPDDPQSLGDPAELEREAADMDYAAMLTRLRRIERMAELLDRNIPEAVVLEAGLAPVRLRISSR